MLKHWVLSALRRSSAIHASKTWRKSSISFLIDAFPQQLSKVFFKPFEGNDQLSIFFIPIQLMLSFCCESSKLLARSSKKWSQGLMARPSMLPTSGYGELLVYVSVCTCVPPPSPLTANLSVRQSIKEFILSQHKLLDDYIHIHIHLHDVASYDFCHLFSPNLL